eukprot:7327225-Pyramimonas_sp.AAC.1
MQGSRSRVGLPRSLFRRRVLDTQKSRSRFGLAHDLFGNRAIAQDFLAIHAGRTPTFLLDGSLWPPARVADGITQTSEPSDSPHGARQHGQSF